MSKTILVTGGAGFIGSNFIHHIMTQYPAYRIINIDKLTYGGSKSNLKSVEKLDNYKFIKGDIADEQFIQSIFSQYEIDGIIHFAAQSHVDRSIKDVKSFIDSNILGTAVLLQTARDFWSKSGELTRRRFHHISTDEVYGSLNLNDETAFNEQSAINPRNPYSASKAGSDMLVRSFGYTYDMNVIISSCSNNYGPAQHEEKLIPTIISKALSGETIPIYGDGQNVRDWLYVKDHCEALDLIFHEGQTKETYNIGGREEQTNEQMAFMVCDFLDELKPAEHSYKDLITFVEDRKGHDRRYAINDQKLRQELGWHPSVTLTSGLYNTVKWYIDKWEHKTH